MNNLIEDMKRLAIMLQGETLLKNKTLIDFAEDKKEDVAERTEMPNRRNELDIDININSNIDEEELLDKIEEIEEEIEELLGFDPKTLTLDELMDTQNLVYEYQKRKNHSDLAYDILERLEQKQDKSLYAWNIDIGKWESLIFDEEDYDKLKDLCIIKRLENPKSWIYQLYYIGKELHHRKPLDRYLMNVEDDWQMIPINKNGNILDIRKENYEVVLHPLFREEVQEEIKAAKNVTNWLKDNYSGEEGERRLNQEVWEAAELKAKEVVELMSRAEEIIENENENEGEDE